MRDRDTNRALLTTYYHSIARYRKLMKTRVTDIERKLHQGTAISLPGGGPRVKRTGIANYFEFALSA
jgi:hypothetical protein